MIRAALLATLVAGPVHAACVADRVLVQGDFGRASFAVDLADDPEERSRGLMFVETMPMMSGMLFIYDNPTRATFWMRNTLIPLDMIFVDPTGTVTQVHHDAIPGDETIIDGGEGVAAVLEINGGLAARLGIAVGDHLQHPSFGPDAVLPCE
jgi:uncharacterized membrane protein (UPF0127 family)